MVIKPEPEAVDDLGRFLFTRQWFDAKDDPFHRSPSVMSYDREAGAIVTQDSRVWIAGLGDEAGSGSWLAAAMKEYGRPEKRQVEQLEGFVDSVLWTGRESMASGKVFSTISRISFLPAITERIWIGHRGRAGTSWPVRTWDALITIRMWWPRTGRFTGWRATIRGS
jgi:hypothetical protein